MSIQSPASQLSTDSISVQAIGIEWERKKKGEHYQIWLKLKKYCINDNQTWPYKQHFLLSLTICLFTYIRTELVVIDSNWRNIKKKNHRFNNIVWINLSNRQSRSSLPIQQGWPITSQTMCSAWLLVLTMWFKLDFDSDPATKQNKPKANKNPHCLGARIRSFNFFLPNPGNFLRHFGHLVMSSGHSKGATEAGSMQKLSSKQI